MARKKNSVSRYRRFRASPKMRKTEQSLTRARAALRKARGSGTGGAVEQAIGISAGGAVAAVADAYAPELPGNIDPRLAVGGLLVAAAAMGWLKGDTARWAALAGAGALACAAEDLVAGFLPGNA
jgi:hypothetical protein